MKRLLKKGLAFVLAVSIWVTGLPVTGFAAIEEQDKTSDKMELKDDSIRVTVSGENGGFLIDTVAGDKLKKSDDNKFLIYPSEDYDTSYTSFRVTRKDGSVQDYIFGRDYGFAGMGSSEVTLKKEGKALVASWSVDEIAVEQRLSLLDESAVQHGMVSIGYTVMAKSDDVADVQMRIMMDTALGYQDYAVYEVPDNFGDYSHVRTEKLLGNQNGEAFDGMFYGVNDPGAPAVTAYTLNTTIDGKAITPYQVAFGHWNNLASTVFDFIPDQGLDFTNPYNEMYMTADSAYALYFDLGDLKNGQSANMSTYYGVFSNVTVGNEERAAINFPNLPGSMVLNEAQDAYLSQVEGGRPGDVKLELNVENITKNAVDDITVVVKSQNNVRPYESWHDNLLYEDELTNFQTVISDFQPGEVARTEAYFQVTPLPASEYRKFEVLCYDAGRGETLTQEKLLSSREFYLFCPGALGEVVTFNSIEPQMVYTQGSKNLYISGQNMSLLRDTSAYVTYLRPLSGGEDVIISAQNVIVDTAKNTMYLQMEAELAAGAYQVVFDWNEAGKEDTTSSMLQFTATDKPEYITPAYGIVTIEKAEDYAESTAYELVAYEDEADYKNRMKDADNRVLLEFRGNFSLWYDENGNVTEAKAVSMEDIEGKVSGTITISDCLDVEAGTLDIVVENPGTEEQRIDTNIDAKVYTANSRTKVWDGVCAISSIENGEESTLLQYGYDGTVLDDLKNSVANTNAITLLWPGAAGTAQTIAGVIMEFRYCQFGLMKTDLNHANAPKRRVIAFGAEMSPDFLVPTNFNWSERQTSTMEVVQLKMAKSNYTPYQLRDVQERYAQDQAAWEEAEGGSLALYVHDILFGGGFVGFNTSLEVGIPSYADGLPGIEGTLNLNIMPANKTWTVGIDGEADFEFLQMEASLELKAYNNIPVPNKLYLYIGGTTPGINVDGMGVFWIQGLGGGMDKLYDSLFVSSSIPPLTLMLSGKFALFALMEARTDLNLSMRGFDISMSDIGISGINLIDQVGMSAYWYPRMKFRASLDVNILSVIEGGGYLVVEEDERDGSIFWEGFVTALVKVPKVPLLGDITIGSADLGVNAAKIWGALHILMLDMGVTYYWGGDVDFAFGKYDVTEPTLPAMALASDIPVYKDEETGRILYMNIGTNAVLAAEALTVESPASYAAVSAEAGISSSVDRMRHEISLGTYSKEGDMALAITFDANTKAKAEKFKTGLVLKNENDEEYPLVWLDSSKDAQKQTDANALLTLPDDKGQGSALISFTDKESYNHTWTLTTKDSCDAVLYEMKHLPGLESVDYTYKSEGSQMEVTWSGSQTDKMNHLAVYAIDDEEQMYLLYETEESQKIGNGTASFQLPDTLPSGNYRISVTASNEADSASSIVKAEKTFDYTNPCQPKAPVLGNARLGGDYSIDIDTTAKDDYDGYIVSIFEKQSGAEGVEWTATEFVNQWITPDKDGVLPEILTVGGRYAASVWVDGEGNCYTPAEAKEKKGLKETTEYVGLEAGKTYRAEVAAYKNTADGQNIYLSKKAVSSEIKMTVPTPATVTVSANGAKKLADELDGLTDTEGNSLQSSIDVVNETDVVVNITSDVSVSGTWTLDGGMAEGNWSANPSGTITLNGRQSSEELDAEDGLVEGEHVLSLKGEDSDGDGVQVQYRFRVDATAPKIMLAEPLDGAFFKERMTVEGISEPGAKITVLLDGEKMDTVSVESENGGFRVEVPMNTEKLEQTLTVYAEDVAGNKTKEHSLNLTNELLGAADARLAIFANGEDYTGQTLQAGTNAEVELRVVSGEKSIVIPKDSNVGRQADWEVYTVDGTASLDGQNLVTDNSVNGMLTVTLDKQQAAVVLGGNRKLSEEFHSVLLPENTVGYAVTAEQDLLVADGEDFTFNVEILEGYTAGENFAVYANGVLLSGVDGVYTIRELHSAKSISVEGVADVTPPEVEIKVKDISWKEFLNVITFGNFFKEKQEVTITALDKGSGPDTILYHVSEQALSLEQVRAFGADDWIAYEKAFSIDPDRQYVIYAKVMDAAGNVTYCSSDGLVLDSTAPVVQGLENGGVYYGDQTFTVHEANGLQVKVDQIEIESTDGAYTLKADNKEHAVEVADHAGNTVTWTVTVYKVYTVSFVANGVVIANMQANYGSSIPAEKFPEIPVKKGYDNTAPHWQPGSLENITEDMVIQAVYTKNSDDSKGAGGDSKNPILSLIPKEIPRETVTSEEIRKNSEKLNSGISISMNGNKFTVSWKKLDGAKGYDIFAALCGKTKLDEKSLIQTVEGKKTSASFAKIVGRKISGKKTYQVKIKAWRYVNGKKTYIGSSRIYYVAGKANKKYTNAKKLKPTKKKYVLKKGRRARIRVTVVKQSKKKKLLPKSYGPALWYVSSDNKIAAVTSKGMVNAKKKGTCYITVIALNGVKTKIKITVK